MTRKGKRHPAGTATADPVEAARRTMQVFDGRSPGMRQHEAGSSSIRVFPVSDALRSKQIPRVAESALGIFSARQAVFVKSFIPEESADHYSRLKRSLELAHEIGGILAAKASGSGRRVHLELTPVLIPEDELGLSRTLSRTHDEMVRMAQPVAERSIGLIGIMPAHYTTQLTRGSLTA